MSFTSPDSSVFLKIGSRGPQGSLVGFQMDPYRSVTQRVYRFNHLNLHLVPFVHALELKTS